MESMANAHPRIFVTFRLAHLTTILVLVGSVKDWERSGGCIEKGKNLISSDLGTQ